MGESFWQKDSLITHILFELCLFRNLAQHTLFLLTSTLQANSMQYCKIIQDYLPDKFSLTVSMADIKPLRISTGLAPWVTLSKPAFAIALASTVAVVVPSPAFSFVLLATS